MTHKKKLNTYLKYGLTMLGCTLIGGVAGVAIVYFDMGSLGGAVDAGVKMVRDHLLWIQFFMLILSVLVGEPVLHRFRKLGQELETAGDDEGDRIEYEMEKAGSLGTISSISGMVIAMVLLSTGYSMEYIDYVATEGNRGLLMIFALFIINCIYNGLWQVRYVKAIQKIYPNQKADPTSMKFQKQWLESCDEAEREQIYQASYQTYLCIHRLVSVLAMVSMLCHLIWNTGIMAVVMVGTVWIALTFTYCRACVKKKGSKLNT